MVDYISQLERKTNRIPLFFAIYFLDFFFSSAIAWLVAFYDPDIFKIFEDGTPLVEIFFVTVIFAPLLETFLCQYLVIEILYRFKKISVSSIIIISALIFSLGHYYNIIYIFFAFVSGLVYASYYLYLKMEKKRFPFLYIVGLHALYNFTVFILDDVLGW
ncbi:MAG: type II CAAX prenyl endopeptidase Rce1 family protein [Cyclobacteriaceae bacterium]